MTAYRMHLGGLLDALGADTRILGIVLHPAFTVLRSFTFPKRRAFLQIIDDVTTGIEGMGAVGRPHRHQHDAFDACRYVINYLKERAPFWKREVTPDGARWVEHNTKDHGVAASAKRSA